MSAISDRPGLIALFVAAALGIVLLLFRAVVRGRTAEPVLLKPSYASLAILLGFLASITVGAGVWVWLDRVAKLAPIATPGALVASVFFIVGGLVTSRYVRGELRLRLPAFTRAIPWLIGSISGGLFMYLTLRSLTLPAVKGSRYVWHHEMIRFGALIAGVVFLLWVLSAMLPILLNRFEAKSFVPFVGARHVRATKSGFLTVISVLSICGVGVSSCALCSVVSIMSGFGQDLKRKFLGNNAHIVMNIPSQHQGFEDWEPMLERVKVVPGVKAVTPMVAGEAMASSNASTAGVLVRGIDPNTVGEVIDMVKNIEYGKLDYLADSSKLLSLPTDEVIGGGPGGEVYRKGPDLSHYPYGNIDPSIAPFLKKPPTTPGIIVGRELAKSLHLLVGDELTMLSPMGDVAPMGVLPRARKFRVAAIFYSGLYEFDATHVYVMMDVAQKFFNLEDRITTIEIKANDSDATDLMIPELDKTIDKSKTPEMQIRDWREMNKNLFSALKLERIATFVILSLAIAVASFCIICTLLLMVTEKGKEIAIMKALGATDAHIRGIFMLEGVIIGGIGTAFGVATGVATCLGLAWFGVRLDPDVYYIDRLPVATNVTDYVIVAVSAMVICSMSTIYPATAASKLQPVDGIRHE